MAKPPTFTLETPGDLFRKLERDYQALRRNPTDVDAAFNFFVTATAMRDWFRGPTWKPKRPTWADDSHGTDRSNRDVTLYAVCRDLGNGVKHFQPKPTVESTELRDGTFQADAVDAYAFDVGGLDVRLSAPEAKILGILKIDAWKLAQEILEMWRVHVQ